MTVRRPPRCARLGQLRTERAKFELGLRVPDTATLDAIAQRAGVATYDRDGGGRALFVRDPDHYTIEISAG